MRQIYLLLVLCTICCCTLSAQQTPTQALYRQAVQNRIENGTYEGLKCSDDFLSENGLEHLMAKNLDSCPETTAGYGTAGWNPNSSPETNNVDPSCTVPIDTRNCNGGKIRIPVRNVIFECPNWNGTNYLDGNGFARLQDADLDATYANLNRYFANANVEFVEVERTRQVNCDMYDFYWAQWGPNEPNDQFNDGKRDEKDLPAYDKDNIINIYWSGGFSGNHDCCSGVFAYLDKPPSDRDYAVFRYVGAVNPSLAHHELSHYFGVYHTFWNIQTNNNEKSGRPHTALNNSNCLSTGDGICDTWPDPNFEFKCPRDCRSNGKDTHCYKTNGCSFDMAAYRCVNGSSLQIDPSEGTVIDQYTSTILQDNFTNYNHHDCRNALTPCQYYKLNTVTKSCRSNLCFSEPSTYFSAPSQYDKTINQGDPIPVFAAGRTHTSFDGSSYAVDCFDWFLNENDRWSEAVVTGSSTFDPSPYVNGAGTYTFYLAEANALNNPPCKIAVRLTVRQGNCNNCATCTDGIQNGDETGVDCGGSNCPACPTCEDGVRNGDETGVDCGGSDCPPCAVPTCEDGIQNGDETGVDCGGSCPPCDTPTCDTPTGLRLAENDDTKATLAWDAVIGATSYTAQLRPVGATNWSQQNIFTTSILASPLKKGTTYEWRVRANCDAQSSDFSAIQNFTAGDGGGGSDPTCEDGIQNGDETGVDCGGSDCPSCDTPTCEDGIQNGDETGVDCGGSDCPPCDTPTCEDGIQNGDETGVDCGGSCEPCNNSCDAPIGLFVSDNTGNSVILNWSVVANANNYRVEVRPLGSNRWNSGKTSNNSAIAQPLSAGTTYEWRVRSNCPDETSDWSVTATFVAGASGIQSSRPVEGRGETIWMTTKQQLVANAYPSPTSNLLNLNANQPIDQIVIMDVMGRVLQTLVLSGAEYTVELGAAHLQSGHYFLRVQAGEDAVIVRFVKE
ncbi:MAG: fibronectin type III domain-containing protein [Bacteroidota bacterium]